MPRKKASLSNCSSTSSLHNQTSLSCVSRRAKVRQSRLEFQHRQMLAQGHNGSGRDTFIMFAPHGTDKPMYTPGRSKKSFENGLRESANYISSPALHINNKAHVGKWGQYTKGKSLFDEMLEKGVAFGSAPKINSANYNAGHGVAALIKGGKEHQIEDHLAPGRRAIHAKRPKSANAMKACLARTHFLRRNMRVFKATGEEVDPKKQRQMEFLKKSRARQKKAKGFERHTCGNVYVGKKKAEIREPISTKKLKPKTN